MEKDNKPNNVDGITRVITNKGINVTFLNVYEALKDTNPRNVFLNGQLYVEDRIDTIISFYFGYDNSIRHSSILEFLKSRYCDFSSKIKFLSMLNENKETRFIKDKNLIPSLNTIGEVRNAFQHNLVFEEAFANAVKDGRTFKLINKKLNICKSIEELVNIFKEEVILIIKELDKIMLENFTTQKISIENLKKMLTSPESDKKGDNN